VISALSCSLDGQQITVTLHPGSTLRRLHATTTVVERTTCNYGLNPRLQDIASGHGMTVAATDETGEVRAIERPDHPFFLATRYQPQLTSSPEHPHPALIGFVKAAAKACSAN
jgi:CTP synthase (UTP-ammonia lyase)